MTNKEQELKKEAIKELTTPTKDLTSINNDYLGICGLVDKSKLKKAFKIEREQGFQEGKAEAKQDEIKFLTGMKYNLACDYCNELAFLINKRLQELKK